MTRDLDALFRPRGIAVVGAAPGDERVGGRTLRILRGFGYAGGIYPVSPSHTEIEGLRCYPSVAGIDGPVDLAVLCIGSKRIPDAVRECAAAGIRVVVIYASDFSGEGEGAANRDALERARRETGIRILGPNTIGSRGVVQDGVFATFSHDVESGITPGSVAIVAQSGGLGVYFGSAYLRRRGVGTRYLVDTGNELDITAADVIDHLVADPEVSCIGLILEGSRDGRRLQEAVAGASAAGKRVVLLKPGRSAASAASMATHTGSLAGNADLFAIALEDAGAIVVRDESDFVDVIALLEAGVRLEGRRLGVVSPSGGFAIMALDAAEEYGMSFPAPTVEPTPEEAENLASGDLANPFDYTSKSGVTPVTLKYALQWIAKQDVDAIVFWQAYSLHLDWRQAILLDALDNLRPQTSKPVIGCGLAPSGLLAELVERGVYWFEEPTRMVRALSLVAPRSRAGAAAPASSAPEGSESSATAVTGADARDALGFLPHVSSRVLGTAEEAIAFAGDMGRIVLKVESPSHPHKTDAGLIVGPIDVHGAAGAFTAVAGARERLDVPDPVIGQPAEEGVELVLGAFRDPAFGPCVLVGLGGIHVEVFRDVQLAVAPVSAQRAAEMIRSLRSAPLLTGARGAPHADIAAAAEALAALSRFAVEDDRWDSVDVNPLIVRPEGRGVVAVDAVLVPRQEVLAHV